MGALAIARTQPGEFPPQVIDLLTTFASQSALAMQNARLFHQLEIASQHKSTFLANMSHELRTPLNAIIGYSEMLQEDAVDEGAESLVPDLKRVNAAGKHLLELINSILDLSKIEAGKMELQLEDFSVAGMVEDIACGDPAAGREERQPARTGLRCGRRDDARRSHQSPSGAVQPAEQCVQVHRAGHGVSGSAPGGVGRRRLAELQRERHRNRPERRPARPPVSRVLAGPCRRHAQVRRDGSGTGAEPAALPADGRRHLGDERTGQGQHLHRAFAGRRRADPRDDRSRRRRRGHRAGHRR